MDGRLTCAHCGAGFFSVGDGWGDATCGDCVAARIELALIQNVFRDARRPMRRADPAVDALPMDDGASAPPKRDLRAG